MTSVSLWPATVLRTHERHCSSDSRSAMRINLDPQPHTYHPGPLPSPQRSAWLKYPRSCIFYIDLCMEVYILDDFCLFNTGQFVSPFLNLRAPRGPPFCEKSAPADVRAVIGCDTACTPHKIEPVLSFPHALPAAAPQTSTALWRGSELAHGVNSTKFVSICCCVACGCGCRVCLRRPFVAWVGLLGTNGRPTRSSASWRYGHKIPVRSLSLFFCTDAQLYVCVCCVELPCIAIAGRRLLISCDYPFHCHCHFMELFYSCCRVH